MPRLPSLQNTRIRRNTACAMLLAWLFALASGSVNACALEPHGVQENGSLALHTAHEDATLVVSAHHAEDHTHDAGAADTGSTKESCLKACDEGSLSLLKHASSKDSVDPGLGPYAAVAWAARVHTAPAQGGAHEFRLPEPGPPIPVIFSRLALQPLLESAPE